MTHFSLFVYPLLTVVAFCAGTIDTLAGGGGLISLPALLLTGMNPVTALGTNKFQGAICELSASLHFSQKKQVNYTVLVMGIMITIIGSTAGTILLQRTPIDKLELLIPWLLLSVLIYYLWSQRQKNNYTNTEITAPKRRKFLVLGLFIGFYNGFFGPGTGSIWAVALMKAFKLKLQKATMYAKPLNLAGNLTALSIFISGGRVNFLAAILMGVGSYFGGKCGAMLVVHKEEKWLKSIFLFLMLCSTAITFYKYYGK